ncbi:MAG TPA: hypothetical protein ENI56_00340 [Candidatus Kaiserbacteria bacterium]|nr:hypothetical protein [Candidatus Kaiserbacteria bacterium]
MFVHVEEKRKWGSLAVLSPHEANKRGLASWALMRLCAPSDIFAEKDLVRAIAGVLETFSIKKAYAPGVASASAEIISTRERGWVPIGFPGRPVILRNPTYPADGVILSPGEGCIMSTAGCPVIVSTGGDMMIVAHAGRDSLIERVKIENGYSSRTHLSVIGAIVKTFWRLGVVTNKIHMHVFLTIPSHLFTHSFDHPIYGRYNRRLYELVRDRWMSAIAGKDNLGFCLSLNNLIVAQARDVGVGSIVVSDSISEHPELAHTRDGKNKNRRNLVVVKASSSQ